MPARRLLGLSGATAEQEFLPFGLDAARHTQSTTGMSNGTEERAQWDETAALEELERLRRSIDEWRKRRKDVQAEFEGFVRGFRRPPIDARVELPPVGQPFRHSGSDLESPNLPAPSAPAALEPVEAAPALPLAESGSMPRSANARIRRARTIWVAGVLIALGAISVLLFWLLQSPQDRPVRQGAAVPARSVPAVPRPDPAPAPQPSVSDTTPRSDIVAVQRVWVRVVADGVRVVERELQAGERVPLRAGATSAIRAGNAGALRLTIDGEDRGLLGPEGEVMTRTVRVPALTSR